MNKRWVFLFFLVALSCRYSLLEAAEVIYAKGSVLVYSRLENAWSKVSKGRKLKPGDTLRTARNSIADILLDETKKNIIRIDPLTEAVLNSTSSGILNKIDLSRGKIFARIESLKSNLDFQVSTPSAVAGVRGTGWSVKSSRRADEVLVYENKVYIKTFDAQKRTIFQQEINEGFGVSYERFKVPEELFFIDTQELRQWRQVSEEFNAYVKKASDTKKDSPESEFDRLSDYEDAIKKVDEVKEQLEDQSFQDRSVEGHQDRY